MCLRRGGFLGKGSGRCEYAADRRSLPAGRTDRPWRHGHGVPSPSPRLPGTRARQVSTATRRRNSATATTWYAPASISAPAQANSTSGSHPALPPGSAAWWSWCWITRRIPGGKPLSGQYRWLGLMGDHSGNPATCHRHAHRVPRVLLQCHRQPGLCQPPLLHLPGLLTTTTHQMPPAPRAWQSGTVRWGTEPEAWWCRNRK